MELVYCQANETFIHSAYFSTWLNNFQIIRGLRLFQALGEETQ